MNAIKAGNDMGVNSMKGVAYGKVLEDNNKVPKEYSTKGRDGNYLLLIN